MGCTRFLDPSCFRRTEIRGCTGNSGYELSRYAWGFWGQNFLPPHAISDLNFMGVAWKFGNLGF